MTIKEAIEELKILKEDYWDDDGYGHETKQYDDTMLALDMAINALEQEPILDKIRAEIEEMDEGIPNYYNDKPLFKAKVLRIIDKHRAESGE